MPITNPNRKVRPKEKPFYGQQMSPYEFERIGAITRVDYENNVCSITWLDDIGGVDEVNISCAFASKRSFLGGMPENGSVVICGFSRQTQTSGTAQILSYVTTNYADTVNYLLTRGNYKEDQTFILNGDLNNSNLDNYIQQKISHNVIRRKRRKIYSGEIDAESSPGSEVYLSEDVLIENSRLNEILLRAADQNIISNSLNNTIITAGTKLTNGIISRNLKEDCTSLKQDDDLDNTAPFRQFITLPNGKRLFVVTSDRKSLDNTDTEVQNQTGGGAFTEFRIDLKETASGELNVTEETSESEIDCFSKPMISFLLGTKVGNDAYNRNTYGKVLRPHIFNSDDSITGSPRDEVIGNDLRRIRTLATAFELKFGNSGQLGKENTEKSFNNTTKISIDKQGHMFINLSASTADHPLGAGRSLEFNAEGSMKIAVGANKTKANSIILDTAGGIKATIGQNLDKNSLDLTLKGGMKLKYEAADENGLASQVDYNGDVVENIKGNKTLNIDGSYIITTTGVIDERIRGTKIESFLGDKHTNYGGNHTANILDNQEVNVAATNTLNISGDIVNSDNIVNSMHIVSGTDEQTILKGNKKLSMTLGNYEQNLISGDKRLKIDLGNKIVEVLKGNIEEKITLGDKSLEILTGNRNISIGTGNSSETIIAGNKSLNLSTGDYLVEIGTGNITVKTSIGSVTISGSTEVSVSGLTITNSASTSNEMRAGALALINSPLILLGEGATQPIVKGFELLSWLSTHTHIHPMGPTGPALFPPSFGMLSTSAFVK